MRTLLKYLFLVLCVPGVIGGLWVFGMGEFWEGPWDIGHVTYKIIGVIIMVVPYILYTLCNPKAYNKMGVSVKSIENTRNVTIEDIYAAFKNMDSNMGKPWLGKIKLVKGNVIIFGPMPDQSYVYIHKLLGQFYVAKNNLINFINAPESEKWRLNPKSFEEGLFSKEQILCSALGYQYMVDDVFAAVSAFVEKGTITPFINDKKAGKVYKFTESFRLLGQEFNLLDYDGNAFYEFKATFPLKTFYMYDAKTKDEVFSMSKQIINVLPKYTFNYRGEFYGSFEKELSLIAIRFNMETKDGTFEMLRLSDQLGSSYVIKHNGTIIASLADRLPANFHDIFFDNYIIHVRDTKYTAIASAFAVMAVREATRARS